MQRPAPQQQESIAVAAEVDGVLEELMIAMSIGPTYGEHDVSMALTVIQCVREGMLLVA